MQKTGRVRCATLAFVILSGFAPSLTAQTWTQTTLVSGPPARSATAMAYDAANSRIVLFGGVAGSTALNDTWLWDGTSWTQANPATRPPVTASGGHALVFDAERRETVLFGGGETWIWNGTTWTARSSATNPGNRTGHAMAWDPVRRVVILFGGTANGVAAPSNETWSWNGAAWTKLAPATSPAASLGSMAWDATSQSLVLYNALGETWTWDGTTWSKPSLPASSEAPGPLGKAILVSHNGTALMTGSSPDAVWSRSWLWVAGSGWKQLMTTQPDTFRVHGPEVLSGWAGAWDAARNVVVTHSNGKQWSLAVGAGCTFTQPSPETVIAWGTSRVEIPVPASAGCAWQAENKWLENWASTTSSGSGPGTMVVSVYYGSVQGAGNEASRAQVWAMGREFSISMSARPCANSGAWPSAFLNLYIGCTVQYTHTAAAGDQVAFRVIARGPKPDRFDQYYSYYGTVSISGPAPSTTKLASSSTSFGSALSLLPASGFFTFPSAGTYTIEFSTGGGILNPEGKSVNIDWVRTGSPCTPLVRAYVPGYGGEEFPIPQAPSSDWWAGSIRTYNVGLAPGCAPVAVSGSASWLRGSISQASPGYSDFGISADVNTGPERTATFRAGSWSIPVRQAAVVCTVSLDSASRSVSAGRTTGTIQVTTTASCPWTANKSAAWVQMFPGSGTGPGSISYTVFPNFGTLARSTTISVGGQTFTINQSGDAGTTMERFVKLLYFNYFGRLPSTAEVAFQAGSGQSREQLALNFFSSQEFNNGGRFTAGLYVGLLNRDAEYDGWLFQRDALSSGFHTQESIVGSFLSSAEFALNNPGQNDRAFVTMLYRQVLLREPSSAEVDFHAGALAAGLTRTTAARNFLASTEFAIGTGPRLTAFLAYACLLQRQASPSELSGVGAIAAEAQALSDLQQRSARIRDRILAPFIGSAEFAQILQ